LPHRFLCDRAASAPREGSFRRVNGGQNFRPRALAFFPQGKRFLVNAEYSDTAMEWYLGIKAAILNPCW
jgi:hypothetical protein